MGIEQTIINWIKERRAGMDDQLEISSDTDLLASGLIDSLDFLGLVTFIEENYAITVPIDSLVPDNFGTPADVVKLISQIQNA